MTTTQSTFPSAPSMPAQASLYQQLSSHLAVLKLHDAAAHLPTVMDAATAEGLSLTAALERLLAVEVHATEDRRLAGRLRFASVPTRPPSPSSTETPPPASTPNSSPSSPPAATWSP